MIRLTRLLRKNAAFKEHTFLISNTRPDVASIFVSPIYVYKSQSQGDILCKN